jgi:preprotein translocase subunit SecA
VQIRSTEELAEVEEPEAPRNIEYRHAEFGGGPQAAAQAEEEGDVAVLEKPQQPFVREGQKIGRNDPCPCGSGKKYKHCHGRLT